ncbi:hypothetical protein [Cellvibrio sp. QJXJ]|uniref:hypothetical protein n=1 Tax=Cellvibrio sp. QJXJ TaxID=2964606 RepID=UPI0021C4750B|nr:hypothetical protein [Cellvibrio sp. QJXJ]UUA74680.1 hypothetical protein NNX04_09605 [Cellvibrio sp. QJXJ]
MVIKKFTEAFCFWGFFVFLTISAPRLLSRARFAKQAAIEFTAVICNRDGYRFVEALTFEKNLPPISGMTNVKTIELKPIRMV